MSFMNSYKHLEKLCGEIMRDERRVSSYIDEMTCTPFGPSLVAGWNNDLKKLKHYRHIRNLIAHEPDCSEESLCVPSDSVWIENFCTRILNSSDPLSLYRRALEEQRKAQAKRIPQPQDLDFEKAVCFLKRVLLFIIKRAQKKIISCALEFLPVLQPYLPLQRY